MPASCESFVVRPVVRPVVRNCVVRVCDNADHGLSLGVAVVRGRGPELFLSKVPDHGLFLGGPVVPYGWDHGFGPRTTPRVSAPLEGVAA